MANVMVSVIIATSGQNERVKSVIRAFESVLIQKNIHCIPIIIANGTQFNKELKSTLSRDGRLRFHFLEKANFPEAILYGRGLVDTKYYCFLDDDDVLLENSISLRLRRFEEDNGLDVVVGNGYVCDRYGSKLVFDQNAEVVRAIEKDPLVALFNVNWLASCGGLYKSDTIDIKYFEDYVPYYEWTYLAFRLSICKKIGFIGDPTYIIYKTINSLSNTDKYIEGQYALAEKLINIIDVLDTRQRGLVETMYCNCMHSLSDHSRKKGACGLAIKYHLMSMKYPSGLKYFPYSRHLVGDFLKYVIKPN